MDGSSLYGTQSSVKSYKRYTFNSQPDDKSDKHGQLEFFYIGKDTSKIDFLINTFGCGYAAENSKKAVSVMNRIAASTILPDVIIIDQVVGKESLLEIIQYVSDSKSYSGVPVVFDASGLATAELEIYRNIPFLDEIIFLNDVNKQQLKLKIDFLQKVKKNRSNKSSDDFYQKTAYNPFELKNLIKRSFDIIFSLLLILFLSPVFLFIALAIKLESKGPVLYVSKRAGRGYRIFNFFKFRTMVVDADQKVQQLSHLNHYNDHVEEGPVFFKVINDSRITKVGAFLRNTSMDELPQFFNVLLSDMSFVGNRPLPLYEAAKLTTNDWAERFMAPAGITGLWQIKKGNRAYMSMEKRIKLDIVYSKKYNFMYDLWIMANTPSALIQKLNS